MLIQCDRMKSKWVWKANVVAEDLSSWRILNREVFWEWFETTILGSRRISELGIWKWNISWLPDTLGYLPVIDRRVLGYSIASTQSEQHQRRCCSRKRPVKCDHQNQFIVFILRDFNFAKCFVSHMRRRKVWRSRCCGAGAVGTGATRQAQVQGMSSEATIGDAWPSVLTTKSMQMRVRRKHRPAATSKSDKIVGEAMSGGIGGRSSSVTWQDAPCSTRLWP